MCVCQNDIYLHVRVDCCDQCMLDESIGHLTQIDEEMVQRGTEMEREGLAHLG